MENTREELAAPPFEQMSDNAFSVDVVHERTKSGRLNLKGIAYRRRPMVDILAADGMFSDSEYKALRYYRHHADIADRSLLRDSLCIQRYGSGDGPTAAMLHAIAIVGAVESAAGTLRDILRAVIVYDQSLSQWAMDRAGALERRKVRGGAIVTVLEPRRKALDIAKLEIKMAAKRVDAELDLPHGA